MAEIGRSSMAGTDDSENGNKRIVQSGEEEEDRISSLPDFLIHHILSFLPATDLVKTSVLSKWWNYQWTHVPVLKFVPCVGMSSRKFSNFIDRTLILHECSNIHKFQINLHNTTEHFPNLNLWIRFAVRKDVKELILKMDYGDYFLLPKFVFNSSSLVKLNLSGFRFMRLERVNWGSIKSLRLYKCVVFDGVIENALSGSPLLEHLELLDCYIPEDEELVIASKSLKTLILDKIDCRLNDIGGIEISCPNLERLRVSGQVVFRYLKLKNLSSSVHATLDFFFDLEDWEAEDDMSHDDCINFVQQTLRQVQHVKKLEVGRWLMEWRYMHLITFEDVKFYRSHFENALKLQDRSKLQQADILI